MSSPEPMPVEVIKALALDGELLEELGEMTELIGFTSARYVAQFIGNNSSDFKQAAYQDQASLSTTTPEMPTLRAKAANSLAGNSAITSPLAGLTC